MSIRVAIPQDGESIAHLHHLSHRVSFRDFADPEWLENRDRDAYRDFWRDYLESQPANERTWIYEEDEEIVGTVTIMSMVNSSELFKPTDQHDFDKAEIACLRLMYVHPDFERQGIGTQLMRSVMRFLKDRDYRMATLITHAANKGARRFYEGAGWKLDELFEAQVEEFFDEPLNMRRRARYKILVEGT